MLTNQWHFQSKRPLEGRGTEGTPGEKGNSRDPWREGGLKTPMEERGTQETSAEKRDSRDILREEGLKGTKSHLANKDEHVKGGSWFQKAGLMKAKAHVLAH